MVILSTQEHWKDIQRSLIRKGFDTDRLISEGKIKVIDVMVLYEEFSKDGDDRFVQHFALVAQEIIYNTIKKFTKVRIFWELVDVLCAHGKMDIAIEVEKKWHEYVKKYDFTLFCAYASANINVTNGAQVVKMCEHHTHIL